MKYNDMAISLEQMIDAIQESGYLLEQQVKPIMEEEGFFVETNPVYPDPTTGKSREIDINAISAIKIFKEEYNFIFPKIICECENNHQPVIFFEDESPISFLHHYEVKASGIPVKIWQDKEWVGLSDFVNMEKYHHYCKGLVSTQYCTFMQKKDNKSWVALHDEEKHSTFNSIINALEYEIATDFDGWSLPNKDEIEDINVNIYFPLLILKGLMYSATIVGNKIVLKKTEHVQFRRESYLPRRNEVEAYQIDAITSNYLKSYLKIVSNEMLEVKKRLQRKKGDVRKSIDKIVIEAYRLSKAKGKTKSFRDCLEF